jgi:carbon-monoxide dehydrogenase medium subunit
MILDNFEYIEPETLKEVTEVLLSYGPEVYVLAGGTDLVVKMHRGTVKPSCIIDLKHVMPVLRYIELDSSQELIRIGSLTTFNDLVTSKLIREKVPVLAQAAGCVGSRQIRSRGTLGGNLCSALPSADTPPALLVLGARAVLAGKDGERILPLNSFFKSPGQTNLFPGEVLKEVEIPLTGRENRGCYLKHTKRRALDLALVGVAAFLEFNNNTISECRIAFATAAPTPVRAYEAEDVLRNKPLPLEKEVIASAVSAARSCARPRTSRRATAEYRLDMIEVLTRRALNNCLSTDDYNNCGGARNE